MQGKNSFKISIIFLSTLVLFNMLFLFYSLGKREILARQTLSNATGRLSVTVLEDNTNMPIDNATICIIETRTYETTNKYGRSPTISVPILKNANFNLSLERSWGEITLLVYKDGYKDNISFYTSIMPGSSRVGIVIHLSPILSLEDTKPTISVEYPSQTWAESLIKLYKKRV